MSCSCNPPRISTTAADIAKAIDQHMQGTLEYQAREVDALRERVAALALVLGYRWVWDPPRWERIKR